MLLLVPEISLTPQTLQQLQQRFNTQIVAYHSKITAKEKTLAWIQAKLGIAKIIIGTRSAAFIPLQDPGIFVIDEEHDQSFKQQEGFRYSARDLLIKRAQLEQCPIILGSATPALETLWNAKQQRYLHLQMQYVLLEQHLSWPALLILNQIDRHTRLVQGEPDLLSAIV